jgi:hypothetical protein
MGCGCNNSNNKQNMQNKEKFINISNFLSNNWIYIVLSILIIICLIYFIMIK